MLIENMCFRPRRLILEAFVLVRKRRPQSEGKGVCPVWTFNRQGDSSDADVQLFVVKTSDFSKIMVYVCKDPGGCGSADIFLTKREG